MQSTRPQSETNPENAQHSTGPQTAEGKAAVALNSLTHGMCCKGRVLVTESQAEFDQLLADLTAEWAPATTFHRLTVRELADEIWLLQRGRLAECQHLDRQLLKQTAQHTDPVDPVRETAMADAILAEEKQFELLQRYIRQTQRHIDRLYKRLRQIKADAVAEQRRAIPAPAAPTASAVVSAADPLPTTGDESSQPFSAQNTPATVNWREIVQELYYAVSAGPQHGHPLPETYYGAYAIWYKQTMMVASDIGDDEAGSQLAAVTVAFQMRDAGVLPLPGHVWGAPDQLADWRENARKNDPYETWCDLVRRDYGRRGVTFGGPEPAETDASETPVA